MARELVGVMTMVSKVLERVPKDLLSVVGVPKGVGTVKKSVVSKVLSGQYLISCLGLQAQP